MEARWTLQLLDIFFAPKWLASRNEDLKSNVSTHFPPPLSLAAHSWPESSSRGSARPRLFPYLLNLGIISSPITTESRR